MKRLKLVFGTYNTKPVGTSREQFERTYQNSYKPFLTVLYKYPKIRAALHFSGYVMEWLEEEHPEFVMLLNELVKRKQVELLGGGYYSPILPIIPSKDRMGQIELLTTYLRKRFGKRPRGCWIQEGVWEPAVTSTIKSNGMEYFLLDDIYFYQAGMQDHQVYRPYITDDQGKTTVVLPIHYQFAKDMFAEEPEDFARRIYAHAEKDAHDLLAVLFSGELFEVNQELRDRFFEENGWLERFFHSLSDNLQTVQTVLPGRYVRNTDFLEKAYLPSAFLPPAEDKRKNSGERWLEPRGYRLLYNIRNERFPFFFRQYITRYPEIRNIYSKMMYVHLLVGQVRRDKSRKKTAKEESWIGQCGAAFWHAFNGGVYDNAHRKAVYTGLLNAEKTTREKGIFSTSLNITDFNLDGKPEYLYQGQFINAYVQLVGASVFELDYVVNSWNYIDTMGRYREAYHDRSHVDQGIDYRPRNAFEDHLWSKGETLEHEITSSTKERIDFSDTPYRLVKAEKERKELEFAFNGMVDGSEKRNIQLRKSYDFQKNSIYVDYGLRNTGSEPLEGVFASEINLSFQDIDKERVMFLIDQNGNRMEVADGKIDMEEVGELTIQDRRNKTLITISPGTMCGLWSYPVYTLTKVYNEIHKLYQGTCFIFRWHCSVPTGEEWKTNLSLRIEKK
jgi:alpha-amylase